MIEASRQGWRLWNYKKPKGPRILPGDSAKWLNRRLCTQGLCAIRLWWNPHRSPALWGHQPFSRECTTICKRMYDFYDKGDRHITLRQKEQLLLSRSYVENKLFAMRYKNQVSSYYIGPMFHMNVPQAWVVCVNSTKLGVRMLWIESSSCNGCRNHCHGSDSWKLRLTMWPYAKAHSRRPAGRQAYRQALILLPMKSVLRTKANVSLRRKSLLHVSWIKKKKTRPQLGLPAKI